jgi:Xaa-Pro aminopeptidase
LSGERRRPGMERSDEREIKHERVVEYLDAHSLDAVVLGRRCNFSWYTCGARNYVGVACDVGNSWLVVSREGAKVLASNIEASRLRAEELGRTGIEVTEFPYHDPAGGEAAFREATAGMRLGADAPAPGVDAPGVGADFDRLRWTLTKWEIERLRALAADTAEALETVARSAVPGQTENHLAGAVAGELFDRGCVCWTLLVGADERIERFRHPLPTDTRAEKYFMLVVGAERDGLIVSCTRIGAFGKLGAKLAARHRAVATVDAALILATRCGATLGEIFAVAQRAYAAVGYGDEWRMHHQGGSCGYLPREVKASPGDPTVVLGDQPFAWNPSIAGTKSEDTILCGTAGAEVLSTTDDWPIIEVEWDGQALNRPDILIL